MPRIGVVTDSTADFPGDLRERLEIEMVPLSVTWDTQSFQDKIDLSTADFYRMLGERSSVPTTSAPPAGLFEETYSRLLGRVDHVISVHLASKLSATCDVARGAAERVGDGRVTVIDSGQTTMCLGWLTSRAGELAREDAPVDRVIGELQAWVPRLRLYAVLDTLKYLERGGRIGRAQALIGSLLNFKPLLAVRDGEVHPLERPRSRSMAMRRLVEVALAQGTPTRLGILHGATPELLDELERLFAEQVPNLPVERAEIGIVIGTHAGPGVLGACALLPG